MTLLSVILTATDCWDICKIRTERNTKEQGTQGRCGREKGQGCCCLEQIKASQLLAAGAGSPVPDRAAALIREAGEMRLPPTPAFGPIT